MTLDELAAEWVDRFKAEGDHERARLLELQMAAQEAVIDGHNLFALPAGGRVPAPAASVTHRASLRYHRRISAGGPS